MTNDAEVIPFHVTFGAPGDKTFDLRFPLELKDEIVGLLDDAGIDHGSDPEISGDEVLAMEAVKVLESDAGIRALSSMVGTFLKQREGEGIALKLGDTEIDAANFSVNEAEQILQTMAAEQTTMDREWFKQLGKLPDHENE
jgi:hypothetical protein